MPQQDPPPKLKRGWGGCVTFSDGASSHLRDIENNDGRLGAAVVHRCHGTESLLDTQSQNCEFTSKRHGQMATEGLGHFNGMKDICSALSRGSAKREKSVEVFQRLYLPSSVPKLEYDFS